MSMLSAPVTFDVDSPVAERCRVGIEVILGAMLVFAPLAYGATEPWSLELVLAGAIGMLVLLGASLTIDPQRPWVRSWAYLPLGLFIALVVFQMLPLPSGVVGLLSPATASTRHDLLGGSAAAWSTLSLYPHAAWQPLWIVLAASAVFVVVVNVFQEPRRIRRLLGMMAIAGAAVVAIALYQNLTGSKQIYGVVPVVHPDSGPFMNHSHFGQFVNLAIGGTLGLLLVRLADGRRPRHRRWTTAAWLKQPDHQLIVSLIGLIVLAAVAVCLSLTRGGILAMVAAGTVTGGLLGWRSASSGRSALVLALGILIVGTLLCFGFSMVYDRLASLRAFDQAQAGRWQILLDLSRAWAAFPIFGTGLGTHQYIFPMFDHSSIPRLATYAENEYAQALEETGVLGLGTVIGFLAVIGYHAWHAMRRQNHRIKLAAFGLTFGLLAVMIHSFTDFGQHVPAVALFSAVSAGLLVNLSRYDGTEPDGSGVDSPAPFPRQWRRGGTTAVVALAGVWVMLGADTARQADAAWGQAQTIESKLRVQDWQGTNQTYADLIGSARQAVALDPGDAEHRYWLSVYRWESISRDVDEKTGDILLSPEAPGYVKRILRDLQQVQSLCPTFGPAYALAGQLERSVLDRQEEGAAHIQLAARLTSYDPTVALAAGMLNVDQHKFDAAMNQFERATRLGGTQREALRELVVEVDRPELAFRLARDDRAGLDYLADLLKDRPGAAALAAKARARADDLLHKAADAPSAPAGTLAALASTLARQGHREKAIAYYQKALAQNYGQLNWRMDMANLLAKTGQSKRAMHEAGVCLRLRPEMGEAKALIAKLSVQ